jgi:hypothetical protein
MDECASGLCHSLWANQYLHKQQLQQWIGCYSVAVLPRYEKPQSSMPLAQGYCDMGIYQRCKSAVHLAMRGQAARRRVQAPALPAAAATAGAAAAAAATALAAAHLAGSTAALQRTGTPCR